MTNILECSSVELHYKCFKTEEQAVTFQHRGGNKMVTAAASPPTQAPLEQGKNTDSQSKERRYTGHHHESEEISSFSALLD